MSATPTADTDNAILCVGEKYAQRILLFRIEFIVVVNFDHLITW